MSIYVVERSYESPWDHRYRDEDLEWEEYGYFTTEEACQAFCDDLNRVEAEKNLTQFQQERERQHRAAVKAAKEHNVLVAAGLRPRMTPIPVRPVPGDLQKWLNHNRKYGTWYAPQEIQPHTDEKKD